MKRSTMGWRGNCLVLMFFITLFFASGIAVYMEYKITRQVKELTRNYAETQAIHIRNVIENQLNAGKTVRALLVQGQGNILDFDSAMEEIMADLHINNISIAPGGVITQVYPLAGNEKTIGHDVLNDPERTLESKRALESGKLTTSGPYRLKQGWVGLIGRQPVFLTGDKGGKQFWGFVNVTLKFPDAIKDAGMERMEELNYCYELWRTSPETGEKQIIMASEQTLMAEPVSYLFELPNSEWTLSISPLNGWVDYGGLFMKELVALLVAVLATLLAKSVIRLANSRDDLDRSIRQQTENYRQMNQMNVQLGNFRHDIKNHLICLAGLLQGKRVQEAQAYIQTMNHEFLPSAAIFNTENYIFDALLAEKRAIAAEKAIPMDCDIRLDRTLEIENVDWSILYGNLLDNALEAAQKTGNPYVRIVMSCRGNLLHTKISNTAIAEPDMINGRYVTSKSDKNAHGIGLEQVSRIVRKYKGSLETQYADGVFSVSFLLLDV